MADKAMDVYLNDHLAGATLGVDLAGQIREHAQGTPLGDVMSTLHAEIEQDRQTLVSLMQSMGTTPNPIKKATGWLAEKAVRVKFSGLSSGEAGHGLFMALESLALGIEGKGAMWRALRAVRSAYAPLDAVDLDALIARAGTQHATLEPERVAAATRALTPDAGG